MKILFFVNFETQHTNYFESFYRDILIKSSKKIKITAINFYYKKSPEIKNNSLNNYLEYSFILNKFNIIFKIILINFKFLFKKKIFFYFRSIFPFLILCPLIFLQKNEFIYDFDGDPLSEKKTYRKKLNIFDKFISLLQSYALKKANKIVTRNSFSKTYLINKYKLNELKIMIIENAINTNKISLHKNSYRTRLKESLGINKNDFVLVYSGSIGKQYLITKFLELHKLLKKNIKNYHAIIFSNSINLKNLNIKLDSKIKLLNLSTSDYKKYLCIGDVGYALRDSSSSMMFVDPIKYGEYLSSGIYILYTNLIGSLSYNQNNSNLYLGYRSLNNDIKKIFNVIMQNHKIIKSYKYKLKRREYAIKNYNIDNYSNKLVSLFENI